MKTHLQWLDEHFISLCVVAVFFLACQLMPAISRDASHFFRMVLAGLVIILLLCHFQLLKGDAVRQSLGKIKSKVKEKIFYTAAIVLCIFGIFNYYQFDEEVFLGGGDYADVTYYYLNSKYFDELGYSELYPAMLLADEEAGNRLSFINSYRDLYTYEEVPREKIYDSKVKYEFSRQRWQQFKDDVDYLVGHNISGGWGYFFIDHGYNAPPTWTIIGGTLSNLVPVEKLKWITSIDILLVAAMFVVIFKVFGLNALIYSLLFFVVTFSGRWPILGQALLRFDWLAALVVAMAMLKKERYGLAGGLIMFASLSRIFPVLFFIPYGFYILFQVIKDKKIDKFGHSFMLGAGTVFLFLLITTLLFLGWPSFIESAETLQRHSHTYSSHRVGLADALFFRFETTREEMSIYGGIPGKKEAIASIKPMLYGLGLVSIAAIGMAVYKKKWACYAIFPYPLLTLFIVQNPQINYFNIRILLVIYHLLDITKARNKAGLVILFLIELAAQWTKVAGYERYTTTSITSLGLCLYFMIIGSLLLIDYLKQDAQLD